MDNPQKPTLSWQSPAPADKPKTPQPPLPTAPKKVPEAKSNTAAYAGVFVGGLIIGALLGWGITSSHMGGGTAITSTSTDMTAASSSTAATSRADTSAVDLSGASVGGLGGLTIPSSQQSGFNVAVSQISVTQPTWVVVYEDQNGLPGNALGAALFYPASQGGASSGAVQLLRGTLPGQTYLAGESVDDGDHIFSLQNDKPVRDSEGNPLFVSFSTN